MRHQRAKRKHRNQHGEPRTPLLAPQLITLDAPNDMRGRKAVIRHIIERALTSANASQVCDRPS